MRKQPPENLVTELAGFPHIVTNVTLMWGSKQLDAYLTELMLDTRDGQRRGFSHAEASAIHQLIQENDQLFRAPIEPFQWRG